MRMPAGRDHGDKDIALTSGSIWSWARVSTLFFVLSTASRAGALGPCALTVGVGACLTAGSSWGTPFSSLLTAAPAPLLTQVTCQTEVLLAWIRCYISGLTPVVSSFLLLFCLV